MTKANIFVLIKTSSRSLHQDECLLTYFNKAEVIYTVEQFARGKSRSNNFPDNSITMNDHNVVPLFVEEQLTRREHALMCFHMTVEQMQIISSHYLLQRNIQVMNGVLLRFPKTP